MVVPCYATVVLNANNSQDPLKNDRQRSGDNNKKGKSDTCNTELFCQSLSVIEWIQSGISWIYSKPKSAAAKSKGWPLEYDHNSKSRFTWSFFSLANRQKLYEIPMITVMLLYLVASSYLSVFLRSLELSGLRLQPRSNQLWQKNYQVIYIVNQFTIYAALFFMHIYVGYCVWGGIMIRSEGVFPVELVRDQFLSWIGAYHFSRQLIQRTV